ncbi:hypothetical protein [Staphylococcus hyicus]|uniref:hypothetical protein n=1 Tax=Staphylococcus hyicus TaxID=1284 RepID=UPI00313333BF
MVSKEIDFKKSGKKNDKFTSAQLLRKLRGLNKRDIVNLSVALFDKDAKYDAITIESANKLLDFMNNSGINYTLMARNDGGGLLAKAKGLGGNDLIITVAPKDRNGRSSEKFVGNVNINGKNYYLDHKTELLKSIQKYIKDNNIERDSAEWKKIWYKFNNDSRVKDYKENKLEYLIKGLTGQLPTKTLYNKGDSNSKLKHDHAHAILDNKGRPIVNFYRLKKEEALEQEELGFVDNYFEMKKQNIQNLEATPLQQMVIDTNKAIEQQQDENGLITRDEKGFQVTEEIAPMIVEGEALNGINLDILLQFHDRDEIAKAISYELRHNTSFDMNNALVLGEDGLKDLLMEETAGVNAKKVSPQELGSTDYQKSKYEEILNITKELLEKQGISDVDLYFDEDHVINWRGNADFFDKKAKGVVKKERNGQIGQIFLPDERGLIKTAFKTVSGSEDRNYNMVTGYRAFYQSNAKESVLKPKTIRLKNSEGIEYEAVAAYDKNGNLIPYKTPNGKGIRPERLPEDELKRIIELTKLHNERNPNNPYLEIATEEVQKSLKDRLRLKGFDQSIKQQLESVVSKQVLQDTNFSLGNTSLNKLYHGDVYGIRIAEHNLNNDAIVETYKNRVKFEDDVLYLSNSELDSSYEGEREEDYDGEDYSHRFNIRELDGIFDRSLSSDGANLGLVRYLNKDSIVLETGEVVQSQLGVSGHAKVVDDLPFTEADPGDRSMMAGNQYMKSRNVQKTTVALMTYKGYTFEDGAVISEEFAKEQGAIVNGYDENGEIIPLEVGDKISDMHGNKATVSYVASREDDVFKENPDLHVIMNPHSIPSRMNTGVVHEMLNNGQVVNIKHNGEIVAEAGQLNVVITDITARNKTKTYENEYDDNGQLTKRATRKGRSFGVQEAWVANALELNETMKEIYGQNKEPFEKLRAYMNVTGLDIDEDTTILQSNGFNNGSKQPSDKFNRIEISHSLDMPREGGYMELPVEVKLPSGIKTKYLNVLPEKFRQPQDLFDGDRMYHEYTTAYSRIAQSALVYDEIQKRYKVMLQDKLVDLENQDLATIDLSDSDARNNLRRSLTNDEDIKEFTSMMTKLDGEQNKAYKRLQGKVNALTSRVIEENLGGRSKLTERLDEYGDSHMSRSKNTNAIKKSIIKKEIMGKQVPNSVTSIVTAEPNTDIYTIKVSPEIYKKLDVKDPNQRVLLWRDPALHDGSMRAFKVEKDENIVGVGINPLVTESFGMDFDGDTVGVYAPKSKEAQKELIEKASIEKNLLDATSKEFSGNIGMDFVSSAYKQGYIGDENKPITQGYLLDKQDIVKDESGHLIKPKDQLQKILNDMAYKGDVESINQLWKDIVTSDKNIASSKVDFHDREAFRSSIMHMAEIGAKGKPKGIEDPTVRENMDAFEKENGRPITYLERMKNPDKYIASSSTVMDYYDRGKEMFEAKQAMNKGNLKAGLIYKALYNPYRVTIDKDGKHSYKRNVGSLGYDQDKTRMAQSGKTDLTGLAGAKSQTLVSLMYDKKGGAMAAMEVTEPLTQATLKLKHDPAMTPEIKKLLNDYDDMLSKGGYSETEFIEEFKSMYDKVGLDVREEHLKEVFTTLSTKDAEGITKTAPIQDVIEKNLSPLMKANLYGYDALRETATGIEKRTQVDKQQYEIQVLNHKKEWVLKDSNIPSLDGNMTKLKVISLGKVDENQLQLNNFKQGQMSSLHIPNNLNEVTISSRKSIAHEFAKKNQLGIYQDKDVYDKEISTPSRVEYQEKLVAKTDKNTFKEQKKESAEIEL